MTRDLNWTRPLLAALFALLLAPVSPARSHHHHPGQSAQSFDYYLLALSYAPDFCDQSGGNKSPQECGSGRQVGFVVHGLWPQSEAGRGPENCGSASPVSQDLVQLMLTYIPTASLIQHEWKEHGVCTGLSAADFFAAVRKARDSVQIPTDLAQPTQTLRLTAADIETKFAAANPTFPKEAFQVSCYHNQELQEARVCFDKFLTPRACGAAVGQCDGDTVTVLPVN